MASGSESARSGGASWSARQYTAFEAERTRPVRDLLAAVPASAVRTAVDLGCGPGNSTEELATRFPNARVSGIDSSADMLTAARQRLPQVSFQLSDIAHWQPGEPMDVILANAVLQWVPDHDVVLPALVTRLRAGGSLAVQMPDNLDEPAHRLMREVAADGPWASRLSAQVAPRVSLPSAVHYYRLLRECCGHVDVWHTTYHHVLAGGSTAVVEWFKGSGLRPYLEPLEADDRAEFLRRYAARIATVFEPASDGSVLLPFPRLFFVATR